VARRFLALRNAIDEISTDGVDEYTFVPEREY
jgi:hypothetical protein